MPNINSPPTRGARYARAALNRPARRAPGQSPRHHDISDGKDHRVDRDVPGIEHHGRQHADAQRGQEGQPPRLAAQEIEQQDHPDDGEGVERRRSYVWRICRTDS